MNLAIIGSHELSGQQTANAYLRIDTIIKIYAHVEHDLVIVSGGAEGVDRIAEETAKSYGIPVKIFEPEVLQWEDKDGKRGYKSRNIDIARNSSAMVTLRTEDARTFGSHWTANYFDGYYVQLDRTALRLKI